MLNPRDYEFRAWDTYNERMVYDPYRFVRDHRYNNPLSEHADEDRRFNAPYLYYETWQDVDDGIDRPCHIMQFTGCLDKQGKKIFEGDIVKITKRYFDFDKDDDDDTYYKDEISYIVYSDHGFWVNDESFGWEGEDLWRWSEMSVIGNVFENADLLPVKIEPF